MKFIITESKIENLINKTLGYKLSDRIEMITSWEGAPVDCRYMFPSKERFNKLLNEWGPMYWFRTPEAGVWLAQQRENRKWYIYNGYYNDVYGTSIDEYELLKYMGMSMFGISLNFIIDNFVEEEI